MKLLNKFKPDLYNGNGDTDEGEQYWKTSVCYQLFHVMLIFSEVNCQNIRKTVVTLQPELKIGLERGFDDQGKSDCDKGFEQHNLKILYE